MVEHRAGDRARGHPFQPSDNGVDVPSGVVRVALLVALEPPSKPATNVVDQRRRHVHLRSRHDDPAPVGVESLQKAWNLVRLNAGLRGKMKIGGSRKTRPIQHLLNPICRVTQIQPADRFELGSRIPPSAPPDRPQHHSAADRSGRVFIPNDEPLPVCGCDGPAAAQLGVGRRAWRKRATFEKHDAHRQLSGPDFEPHDARGFERAAV